MIYHLKTCDILTLGFMTFALFVGAGNIIFPPMIALQAGEHVWITAIGFLITAVGLPILTVITLAQVSSRTDNFNTPIDKITHLLLSSVCYLVVGPLFAIPRTATVSYEIIIAPLINDSTMLLFIYSLVYFTIIILVSLYPNKLFNTVGHFLAPLKIFALFVLLLTVIIYPAGPTSNAMNIYKNSAFSSGFVNGYLTMDMLSAIVFHIIIVNAVRSRGIITANLLARYTTWAGLMAGFGLILLYLMLFRLGSNSATLVDQNADGIIILRAYVQHAFGNTGNFLLMILFFLACLVTAVGLTCACAEFFAQYLLLSYRTLMFIIGIFSMGVSNLGLKHLIKISLPFLAMIHPPCIVMVILSFTRLLGNNSKRIIAPTMLTSLFFGILDGVQTSSFASALPTWRQYLPLSEAGLSWVFPTIMVLILSIIWERAIKH